MIEPLRRRLDEELSRAAAWSSGDDPTPVFHALGYALWVRAADVSALLTRGEAAKLARQGQRALLSFDALPAADREDQLIARQRVADVARAAVASLSGKTRLQLGPADAMHPPARTLWRLQRGEASGLTAGRYAAHVLECRSCKRELEVLRIAVDDGAASRPPLIAVAAAAPASVRSPTEGRRVGVMKRPAMEAMLFDDEEPARLAIYADAMEPVRVVADGVTTEDSLDGYWIGRVEPGVTKVEARVHVGDETVRWEIEWG